MFRKNICILIVISFFFPTIIYAKNSPNPYVEFISNRNAPTGEFNIYDIEDLEHKALTAYKLTRPLIILNGEFVINCKTIIENGCTLVPLRFLGENLAYNVNWNEKEKTVDIYKDNKHIIFVVGYEDVAVLCLQGQL